MGEEKKKGLQNQAEKKKRNYAQQQVNVTCETLRGFTSFEEARQACFEQ